MKTKTAKFSRSISIYSSLEQENEAEYRRRAAMTPDQRLHEFGVMQERAWGTLWTRKRMKRVASYEIVTW
jgi:hypothetical protein